MVSNGLSVGGLIDIHYFTYQFFHGSYIRVHYTCTQILLGTKNNLKDLLYTCIYAI